MRRPAPQLPISPKLLKQFAGGTLVITGLVALFANGEAEQAKDAFRDRAARNQLLAAEAKQRGPQPVALHRASPAPAESWGADAPDQPATSASVGGSIQPALTPSTNNHSLDPIKLMNAPGRKLTVEKQLAIDVPGPIGEEARSKLLRNKKKTVPRPTAAQIEQIKAASRSRTGSPETRD